MSIPQNNDQINILPDYLANQIAAGEVVQRPESVVKELVENAIDAGATEISVTLKDSGKQLIYITDNGRGMTRENLMLSIKRHATSKIVTPEDLERIMTFGFRGEALASIAAVANLEIRSKDRSKSELENGWKLESKPQLEPTIEEVQTFYGTQIFVKNLFFNVPARRKFLKSNLSEFRYVSETLLKFALSYPNLRLTFFDDESLVFDSKPETLEKRISYLISKDLVDKLLKVEYENDGIKINGFISRPDPNKGYKHSYIFLNKRWIQSKLINHAILSAYGDFIDRQNLPFYVLDLTIDASKYDINIHPQKHEVKFDNDKSIYNSILQALTETLAANNIIQFDYSNSIQNAFPFKVHGSGDEKILINTITGEVIEDSKLINITPTNSNSYGKSFNTYGIKNINSGIHNLFGLKNESLETHQNQNQNIYSSNEYNKYIKFKDDFIITLDEEIFLINTQNIVDQSNSTQLFSTNQLLFPIKVNFDCSDEHINILQKFGFEVNKNIETSITHIPNILKENNAHHIFTFSDFINDITESKVIEQIIKNSELKKLIDLLQNNNEFNLIKPIKFIDKF